MDSVLVARPKWLSRTLVQRAHGTVLILLGSALAIVTTYSEKTGTGMYPFLRETPITQVGLLQAYLLMALIGVAVLIGASKAEDDWRWSALTIFAHCVPLLALFMYWEVMANPPVNQGNARFMSMAIHFPWISIDLLSIFLLKPRQ